MSSRDGGNLLENTLNSIRLQTRPPKLISVVIDGGDITPNLKIIEDSCRSIPYLTIEHRGREFSYRDVRRMSANLNEAYNAAIKKIGKIDFLFISGDDCHYPSNYVEDLMQYMIRDNVTVASGICMSPHSHPLREMHPTGSGRMIRHDYWLQIGASFPLSYGWETWLLYRAEMDGEKVTVYSDLQFNHLHPRGRTHGFIHWGKARYLLGFHPLYMLGRTVLDLSGRGTTISKKGTLKMLLGYLFAPILFKIKKDSYAHPLTDIQKFVRERQLITMREKLKILLK